MGTKNMAVSSMRLKGLLIAFFIAFGLGFLVDIGIEHSTKKTIIALVSPLSKSKVEIDDVALSYFPLKLTISGLTIQSKDQPDENAMVIDTIQGHTIVTSLLQGRLHLDLVSVDGVAFNTKRVSLAKEPHKTQPSSNTKKVVSPPIPASDKTNTNTEKPIGSYSLSDLSNSKVVDAIVDKHALSLQRKTRTLQDDITQLSSDISLELKNGLPKNPLPLIQKYQKRVQSIQNQINGLSASGQADYDRIVNSLNIKELSNGSVGNTLFNESFQKKLTKGLSLWAKVKDAFTTDSKKERSTFRGEDISFSTSDKPMPGFWIKRMIIKGTAAHFDFDGMITDIGLSPSFQFNTFHEDGKGEIKGTLDNMTISASGFKVEPRKVFEENKQVVMLDSGKLSVAGFLTAENKTVTGDIDIVLNQLNFKGENVSKYTLSAPGIALRVLDNLPEIRLYLRIKGRLTSPQISLSSDLDKYFASAIRKAKEEKIKEIKAEIKNRIEEQARQNQQQLLSTLSQVQTPKDKVIDENKEKIEAAKKEIEKQAQQLLKNFKF